MTELDAMNMLLRLVGSSPVASLDSGHPDAANARTTLRRLLRQSQKRGWWFNQDYQVYYQPQPDTHIYVHESICLLIMQDSTIVQRWDKLYDKCNQTYSFYESKLALRQVTALAWDDVPETFQEYVAYFAAVQYVRDELEDPDKQQELKESTAQAFNDVKKLDLEAGRYNIFHHQRTLQARAGVQPYARNNKRFYGDPDK